MNIYSEILSALEKHETVVLATIISTSGSTPASSLSKMLIKNDGAKPIGTVGGGSMENEVRAEAMHLFSQGRAKILTYHLKDDEVIPGLICGGNLDVLIESITRAHIPLFRQINARLETGEESVLATVIQPDGMVTTKKVFSTVDEVNPWLAEIWEEWKNTGTDSLHSSTKNNNLQISKNGIQQNEIQRLRLPFGEVLLEPVLCNPKLFIFGCGHVGKALCHCAAECGFRVTVIDDRGEYATVARFPKSENILVSDFLEAFDHISLTAASYIVIATRSHTFDEAIVGRALQTSAKYIGMIGSRRKLESIYTRLIQNGTPREQIQRINAPVGIEIGAISPEEIAVSIVAQLVRIRRGAQGPARDKSEIMYSFFHKNDVPS